MAAAKTRRQKAGLTAALLLGLISCGKTAPGSQTALYWNREERPGGAFLADGEGNEAPLKAYGRMVILSPGAVETLYLLGGEQAIAAIAASTLDPVWPPERTAALPSVGNPARPSLEAVIALEPDLVIGSVMNIALVKDLASRGIPAVVHSAESLEDIFHSTRILGILCGREGPAEALITEKREALARLTREIRNEPLGLKGAFLYSVSPVMAFTSQSLAGDILSALGVENIAANMPAAQPVLSPEYLLSQDPDFLLGAVFIPSAEDIIAANPVLLRTRAGREGNIGIIPSSLLLRPSPRIVDGLLELRAKLKTYGRRTSLQPGKNQEGAEPPAPEPPPRFAGPGSPATPNAGGVPPATPPHPRSLRSVQARLRNLTAFPLRVKEK
ncbi:MAG: ABC transporter substrate-binding protein [Spirochaetaceae bacterium]|jgi:iron complex transport system substrate-binding protein|nr:ABC transporter substrate-binding protein [Spirochaetaceae bacterium]